MDDDTPVWVWTRYHTLALAVGGILWVGIWYGAGALIYFILSLK